VVIILIPINIDKNKISLDENEDIKQISLKELNLKENDLEEFLRKNIDLLFEEEDILIIGQQVKNKENGRSDLIAIDGEGNLVLIEIKRDKEDIIHRKEPFEFQAIRYAANLATIKTIDELVNKLFVPYIEKHLNEFKEDHLTSSEVAYRVLDNFLNDNEIILNFNNKQRIILVASEFDNQTLSACSWLISNGVNIKCFTIQPLLFNGKHLLDINVLLPQKGLEDFYVEFSEKNRINRKNANKTTGKRKPNVKMSDLIQKDIVKVGEILSIKNVSNSDAIVLDEKFVEYNGQKLTFNEWGKKMTGWSSINIYRYAFSKRFGCVLNDKLNENEKE